LFTKIEERGEIMKYLVTGKEGPGFASEEEAINILENIIIPSFDKIIELEESKTILAGGLPVGERTFVFIIEASSNEELDLILRDLPMWGSMQWEVKPLQSFSGRTDKERAFVKEIKKM
jgi:hypothetical protein